MSGTFWNRDDLLEASAENATNSIDEMLATFTAAWKPKPPVAMPSASVPEAPAAAPKQEPLSFAGMLGSLTPWNQTGADTGAPAASTGAAAPQGLLDLLPSLMPWAEPKPPAPASGTPAAMPSAPNGRLSDGSEIGDIEITQGDGSLEDHARAEARRLGIDPEMAVRVANTEGGFGDPTRQNMQGAPAYGPYQMYVGGPENPGLGDELLQRGLDPRKPEHARAAITYALEHAARNGWRAFQGAAANGIGDWDGIGQAPVPQSRRTPVQAEQTSEAQAQMPWGTYTAETLTPNQFTDGQAQGMTAGEAVAICGPAAAVAFARANGRQPTLREAKELAQSLGLWDEGAGMHGPDAQVALLDRLGVKAQLQDGADWGAIAREVMAGRPVIVDTPQHYYTVTGFDPQTGEFEFGASAGVLRSSRGKTKWRPEELPNLGMGAPRATIYMGGAN